MIKTMENEPTLLLRVVASILLEPYRERLPPKMGDSRRETGQVLAEVDCQHPK